MVRQCVQYNAGKDLSSNGKKGYSSVVVAGRFIAFPPIQMDDRSVLEFLRRFTFLPGELKQGNQNFCKHFASTLADVCLDTICSRDFPRRRLFQDGRLKNYSLAAVGGLCRLIRDRRVPVQERVEVFCPVGKDIALISQRTGVAPVALGPSTAPRPS